MHCRGSIEYLGARARVNGEANRCKCECRWVRSLATALVRFGLKVHLSSVAYRGISSFVCFTVTVLTSVVGFSLPELDKPLTRISSVECVALRRLRLMRVPRMIWFTFTYMYMNWSAEMQVTSRGRTSLCVGSSVHSLDSSLSSWTYYTVSILVMESLALYESRHMQVDSYGESHPKECSTLSHIERSSVGLVRPSLSSFPHIPSYCSACDLHTLSSASSA
jgi:hypothetical protein